MAILLFSAGVVFFANRVSAVVLSPIVNEVSPYPVDDIDWTELYNPNDTVIDISGWILNNSSFLDLGGPKLVFTAGTTISARGYFVVEKGFGANKFGFDLQHYQTSVTLYKPDLSIASLLTYVGHPGTGHSWGFYPNGNSTGTVTNFATPTRGFSNGGDDTTSPPVPGLVFPADGSSVKPSVAILDWEDVSDPSIPVVYKYKSSWTGGAYGPVSTGTNSFINATGSADRIYNWQVQACDSLNNCSAWSGPWVVTIDSVSPTTTDSLLDSFWHKDDFSVELVCADNFLCGNTYYTLDGTEPTTLSNSGNSFSVTAGGIYTLKYFSTDAAGNSEDVKTSGNTIKIDKTKPAVNIALPLLDYYEDDGWDGAISGTASDEVSGLSKVEVKIKEVTPLGETKYWNGASFGLTEGWVLASGADTWNYSFTPIEGVYTIYCKSWDNAGNISSIASKDVEVFLTDTESPEPVDNLRASVSDSLVVLEWDKSASFDVDYYRIYKSENKKFIPNPETRLAEVSSSERSYDDEDVDNDTTYYYYVIVFDTAGNNSSAEGISAKPSKEEDETVVEEIPNLEIPQGAVLGVEEKVKEVEVPTLKETKTENIVPKESGDLKGSVLALENTVDKEVKPSKSVWDFWWVALILFGMGGIGFFMYRKD